MRNLNKTLNIIYYKKDLELVFSGDKINVIIIMIMEKLTLYVCLVFPKHLIAYRSQLYKKKLNNYFNFFSSYLRIQKIFF